MKDIDTMLKKHTPKPKRQLTPTFTQNVMEDITMKKQHNKSLSIMQRVRKHATVTAVAIGLIGSTAAAATALWLAPNAQHLSTQPLENGNRVVGINLENCQFFDISEGVPTTPSERAVYYEIHKEADITDQKMAQLLKANCEETANSVTLEQHFKLSENQHLYTSTPLVVTAITDTSIRVKLHPVLDQEAYETFGEVELSRISDDTPTYDLTQEISFNDLRAGDSVLLVMQNDTIGPSEMLYSIGPLQDPENTAVIGIMRITPPTADTSELYQAYAQDIVRTEPCSTDPSGFCRAYEFYR